MKLLAITIPMLALVVACGGADDAVPAAIADVAADNVDVSYCSCVIEPISSSERAKACEVLIDSMSQMEAIEAGMACREKPPEGGPDLCFCVQTSSTDPEIWNACEDILPQDLNRRKVASLIAECARKSR